MISISCKIAYKWIWLSMKHLRSHRPDSHQTYALGHSRISNEFYFFISFAFAINKFEALCVSSSAIAIGDDRMTAVCTQITHAKSLFCNLFLYKLQKKKKKNEHKKHSQILNFRIDVYHFRLLDNLFIIERELIIELIAMVFYRQFVIFNLNLN